MDDERDNDPYMSIDVKTEVTAGWNDLTELPTNSINTQPPRMTVDSDFSDELSLGFDLRSPVYSSYCTMESTSLLEKEMKAEEINATKEYYPGIYITSHKQVNINQGMSIKSKRLRTVKEGTELNIERIHIHLAEDRIRGQLVEGSWVSIACINTDFAWMSPKKRAEINGASQLENTYVPMEIANDAEEETEEEESSISPVPEKYEIGEKVKMKFKNQTFYKNGIVVSTNPLLVRPESWDVCDKGLPYDVVLKIPKVWEQKLLDYLLPKSIIKKFEKNGYDDMQDWVSLNYKELKFLGIVYGHRRKWDKLINDMKKMESINSKVKQSKEATESVSRELIIPKKTPSKSISSRRIKVENKILLNRLKNIHEEMMERKEKRQKIFPKYSSKDAKFLYRYLKNGHCFANEETDEWFRKIMKHKRQSWKNALLDILERCINRKNQGKDAYPKKNDPDYKKLWDFKARIAIRKKPNIELFEKIQLFE